MKKSFNDSSLIQITYYIHFSGFSGWLCLIYNQPSSLPIEIMVKTKKPEFRNENTSQPAIRNINKVTEHIRGKMFSKEAKGDGLHLEYYIEEKRYNKPRIIHQNIL